MIHDELLASIVKSWCFEDSRLLFSEFCVVWEDDMKDDDDDNEIVVERWEVGYFYKYVNHVWWMSLCNI